MTDIKWGPAIAVDGKRPGWLGKFADRIGYERQGDGWYGPHPQYPDLWSEEDILNNKGGWETVTAIRLPADHPHYRQTEAAIPEGMKPWHGGIFPPTDWDGGRVWLADGTYEDADSLYQDGEDTGGNQWHHRRPGGIGCDIIAYTPQPTPQADTKPDVTAGVTEDQRQAVFALCEAAAALNVALDGRGWEAERRAVVDGLQAVRDAGVLLPEPVDPDDEVAKQLLDDMGWALGSQPLDGVKPIDIFDTVKAALARGRELALPGEKTQ